MENMSFPALSPV